jgi:hypothetical protein
MRGRRTNGGKSKPECQTNLHALAFKAISKNLRSLRLAAQDVALSRRKQGFESPRERQVQLKLLKSLN